MVQFDALAFDNGVTDSGSELITMAASAPSDDRLFGLNLTALIPQGQPKLSILPNDLGADASIIHAGQFSDSYDDMLLEPALSSVPVMSTYRIEPGNTLSGILQRFGIPPSERDIAITKLDREFRLTRLQAGWDIQVGYDAGVPAGEVGRLLKVAFNPSSFETISLSKIDDTFEVVAEKEEIASVQIRYSGTIERGLSQDLAAAGFSQRMIANVANTMGKRINVNRDIKRGARFEIVMEANVRENGQIKESGQVLYTSIEVGDLSKRDETDLTKEVYYFRPPHARNGYFNPSGRSLTQGLTFLRRPTSGRISSHFNPRRKNPVSGVVRPHNGVDIAAPTGTPIKAGADGKITTRRTNGGFGKFIQINHGGGYITKYAHMSRYQSGLRVGSWVKKGQVIGYVGSTGNSTGPHLHYEIWRNGVARDPIRASLPVNVTLSGSDKTAFNRYKERIAGLRNSALLFGEDVFVTPPQ